MTWIIALTLSITLMASHHADTQAADSQSDRSPWVIPGDDQGNLTHYLQQQYEQGVAEGTPVYVYLYADWCRSCVVFRERAKHGALKRLLDPRRIVMLEFERVNDQLAAEAQYQFVPLLIKITEDGGLGDYTLPDLEAEGPPSRRLRHLIDFFEANDGL